MGRIELIAPFLDWYFSKSLLFFFRVPASLVLSLLFLLHLAVDFCISKDDAVNRLAADKKELTSKHWSLSSVNNRYFFNYDSCFLIFDLHLFEEFDLPTADDINFLVLRALAQKPRISPDSSLVK